MSTVLDEITVLCRAEEGVELPFYATSGASGADIRANISENIVICPGSYHLIPTGLFFQIPEGCELQIRPRSGLALRYGVTILNSPGTIDSDYRGEVGVILINHGVRDFIVTPGMRIAQLVLSSISKIHFASVSCFDDGTARGVGGFGHTGEK